jgi:hypothetical protein
MSPFDISMLAIPISLPMAILAGPSCIDCIMVVVFAILSDVHFIISADAGAEASTSRAADTITLFMETPFEKNTSKGWQKREWGFFNFVPGGS